MDSQPRSGVRHGGKISDGAPVSTSPENALIVRMRLKSAIWVAAYIRRCTVEGVAAVLRRRGAEEAGAIYIIVNRLDGTADCYAPAPQAVFDEIKPADRAFTPALKEMPASESKVEEFIARQRRFDPDLWVVEIEDRSGRHFLDRVVR